MGNIITRAALSTIGRAKIKFLSVMENNAAVYAVGSGTNRFQSTLTKSVK